MWTGMTYESLTGRLYDQDDKLIAVGYSGGAKGTRPDGVNNPSLENVKYVGPLPCGNYTADYVVEDHPIVGKFAIHLKPDESTRAKIISYGRGPDDFFMHGDDVHNPGKKMASDGCLIFDLMTRRLVWSSPVRELLVVACIESLPDDRTNPTTASS